MSTLVCTKLPSTILITKHAPVVGFVRSLCRVNGVLPMFRRELLEGLPRGSRFIGNLPVPSVALICAAGHHYEHVMIPGASKPGAFEEERLRASAFLTEFHVEEID